MKLKTVLSAVLAAALTLGACGEADEVSPSPESEAPVVIGDWRADCYREPVTPEPEPEEVVRNPLTGLATDEDITAMRPYAIMINNYQAALPLHSIGEADIIYEVVAEGGITRLLLVKQNGAELGVIGSVRSTRNYYVDIAQGHDAIHIHAGASEMAYSTIKSRKLDTLDGTNNTPPNVFYRDAERMKTRSSEHCLMTRGDMISQYLERAARRLEHRDYSYPVTFEEGYTLSNSSGSPIMEARTVTVKFSGVKSTVFQYVADDGMYAVEQYGAPSVDQNTGDQIEFTNLLVLYTDIHLIPNDRYDRLEADFSKGGDGVYCVGGEMVAIKWSKASPDKPFTYKTVDGNELVLRAGTSYVCVVQSASQVTAG